MDNQKLIDALAELRIKQNVDYAIVCKYNERRLICNATFLYTIVKTAEELGVEIDEIFTFEYGNKKNNTNNGG